MNIRPSKAAQLAGVARSTIYKDIEDGKLSASLDGKGRKVIDVAELERVYGALTSPDDAESSEDVSVGHISTVEKDNSTTRTKSYSKRLPSCVSDFWKRTSVSAKRTRP